MATWIEFRLLGPLEVAVNGEPLRLGATKQRALLAVLLLRANEFTSHDRLIEALWGERAPAGAGHSLQVYISELRKLLAAHGGRDLLVTRPGGYLIKLAPGQVDLDRFRALVEEGRLALAAGASALGAEKLREALGLWRGEPLADLQFEPFAQAAVERLEELRTAALEDRIDADLGAGRARELLPELEELIGRHPLRERLRGQLMLALYRAGRQAEALQVYQETRRLLIEELGIEPGPELKQLEAAILSHDPTLHLPTAAQPAAERDQPTRHGPGRLRRRLALSGLVSVLAGFGLALFLLLSGGPAGLARVDPNAVGVIDPTSGRIVAEVRAGFTPTDAAFGAGSLWVSGTGSDGVLRIDSKTTAARDTIAVGKGPSGIAFGNGAVWVANSLDGTLSRIDPGTGTVVQTIAVGSNPSAVAVGSGSVWVANIDDRTVSRLDARTGNVSLTSQVGIGARSIAVVGGGVWVTNDAGANVLRVDAKTGRVTDTIGVGNGPAALAFGAGSLWVANNIDGTVSRIDLASRRVMATIAVGDGAGDLAFALGDLWVSSEFGGTVVRIDPKTNRALRTLPVAERPTAIVAAGGRLWMLAGPSASEHRGGTLTVSVVTLFDSIDPARAYTSSSWALLIMTNDGLTGFKRVGGAEGGRLVPDLALSLPTPTEGGTAYTFQLRRGVRYSTGALVRPEDFRHALERVFVLRSPGSGYYRGIIGAEACLKRPQRCDLSRGIVVDPAVNSLTFHLVAPDPEFIYKLALPFAYALPATTPFRPATEPLPTTGPYVVVGYTAGSRLELGRNPRFHEWSRAAQPDGYPDRIILNLKEDVSHAEVTRVLRGETDLLKGNVPLDRLGALATTYPGLLHLDPLHQTLYLFLNTRVRPFDDVRVRRAINYALDRKLFARLIGGQLVQPTCQILPPNFAGYVRYCPYTSRPSPTGQWRSPDLDKARRLIAASRTKGERIIVWIQPGLSEAGARYLAALLRRLGYRASLKFVSSRTYYDKVRTSGTKVQMGGLDGWYADLPVASNFVEPIFSCAASPSNSPLTPNLAEFCDPAIDTEMQRAKHVEATNPLAGDRLWTRIEHELVDRAPWLPVGTSREPSLVSKRVGNYVYSPQWRALIDQLWVR